MLRGPTCWVSQCNCHSLWQKAGIAKPVGSSLFYLVLLRKSVYWFSKHGRCSFVKISNTLKMIQEWYNKYKLLCHQLRLGKPGRENKTQMAENPNSLQKMVFMNTCPFLTESGDVSTPESVAFDAFLQKAEHQRCRQGP